MSTFVLVHGAWGGSYGWHKLRPLLRAAGHDVYTPSLTGLGERSHLASPAVDLATHTTDVTNTLHYEDLRDVVLVGHSYGGMVVTGAADQCPERIAHLVFLDAFVPNDGESLYEATGALASGAAEGEWLVPPIPRSLQDKAEEEWLNARRHGHPRACFTQPVQLSRPLEQRDFSLTYIKATEDTRENAGERLSAFWLAADRTRNDRRWRYREIATSHMVQNEQPQELAALLQEVLA